MYEMFVNFVKSDVGIVISWTCGVAGLIYGIFQRKEVLRINLKINTLINNPVQQNSGGSSMVDGGGDTVNQSGEKNVYVKTNAGHMGITM